MAETADLETQDFSKTGTAAYHLEKEVLEAAGVLLMWSALVAAEGAVRVVLFANPEGGLTPDGQFPTLVQELAAIVETTFGALGLLVATLVLLFKVRNAAIVSAFSLVQGVLSAFVFIVMVIAEPIDFTRRLPGGAFGFSLGLTRFMCVLSVLVVLPWQAAMFGGQFLMASRIAQLINGKPEQNATHKLRTLLFAGLAFVCGLATFLIGVIILAEADGSSPYLATLNLQTLYVIYPELYVTFGLLLMAWAGMGLAGAVSNADSTLTLFGYGWWPVLLVGVVSYSLVLGKVEGAGLTFGTVSAYHTVNVVALTLLPVVFARKMIESKEELDAHEA